MYCVTESYDFKQLNPENPRDVAANEMFDKNNYVQHIVGTKRRV